MAATAIGLTVTAGACVDDSADPSNARLEAIENDPVFELEPPGATILSKGSDPAIGSQPFNFPDEGPTVTQTYHVEGSPQDALEYFRAEIPGLGWQFKRSFVPPGGRHPILTFEKSFGNWTANLSVDYFEVDRTLYLGISAPPVTE